MDNDNVEYLRDAAEHGPRNPVFADAIQGWKTPNGLYVCAFCAARIFGRGCRLPTGTEAVWKANPDPAAVCCVCHEVK